ncbi:hybrid sensor histidine kinase/response regulator transcription factor [Pseudochryseolinea flava]|nr:hybrid sensor histidine kinase/response regulator transcription factor [Pseudochryseolinea flava]
MLLTVARIFVFAGLVLIMAFTSASGQQLFFSNLSTRDGLPSNVINSIAQDSNQFIWIGTGNGLARFDGYSFKTFKRNENANSLPANEISCLLVDGDFLWIGTWRGLCKINTKNFQITRIDLTFEAAIRTLYKDKDNNIWIGTANGLVKHNDGKFITFTVENSKLSHNTIRSIYEDNAGVLWVGTYDGLNTLLPSDLEFKHYDLKRDYKPALKNNLICDIKPVKGNDSLLWIGTETGLCLFNKVQKSYKHFTRENAGFSNEVIKNIYVGPNGELWLGTDFGLNVFTTGSKTNKAYFNNPQLRYSIPNNMIWEIFEDAGGIIWIVTSNGLSRINKDNRLFSYHEITHRIGDQMVGNQSKAILVSKRGIVWIATIHGVVRIDPRTNTQKVFNIESPPQERLILNNVFALEEDDNERIWIGTAGGINVWDEVHKKMHTINAGNSTGLTSNYIAKFIKGVDGSFWVSAWEGGLFKLVSDINTLSAAKFEFVGDFASEKITYALNALWAIHNNQLHRIDLNTFGAKKVHRYNAVATGKDIYTLHYAPQGSIWTGAANELIEYKPSLDSATVHPITTGTDINFNNIISDNFGNIWAASDKFVIKYSPTTKDFELFPLEKDLPLKTFYSNCAARTFDNQILFGGDNGYISFFAGIKTTPYKPNVFITNIDVNNKSIQPLQVLNGNTTLTTDVAFIRELELDYAQRSVTFSFASLHYWQPEINVFAYKLEGQEKEWHYVSGVKNFAVYSNLLPGKYTLKIRGTNNYGIWSDRETSIQVIVNPPLFLSPIFIAIYIVLAIVTILVGLRVYVIRLKLKNEIKLTRVEKEHAEELIRAKQQFFTSISHELRTPISLIIPPIQQIIKRNNLDEENKRLITLAEKNSQRLLRLINQILDFRKLEHENQALKLSWFDLIGFCRELHTLFTDKAARSEITFTFDPEIETCEVWADKEKVEIIIFNLLSNAFKFTPKEGKINFKISVAKSDSPREGYVSIAISDSGIGIAQEEQSKIFEQFYQVQEARKFENGSGIGLTLVAEYTKLHRGEIKLVSSKDHGSTFVVLLPLGHEHFPVQRDDQGTEVDVLAKRTVESSTTEYEFNLRSSKPIILLAEDNADMIDFIQVTLKEKYNFVIAENGSEALNKVSQFAPEIIISDIMMPVMDGLELCRRIKEDNKTRHIPFILLTAKSLTTQKVEGIKMGADIYMTKPFEIELLEAHIDHLLERKAELAQYFKNELITQPQEKNNKENEDDRFLKKVMNTIEANISNPDFSVELLSDEMGMSSTHLYRKLKSLTHLSANEIIKKYRIKKASILLKNKEGNISEIMYEVGFSNLSYFSKCFKTEIGTTPKEYQQRESKHSYDVSEDLESNDGNAK